IHVAAARATASIFGRVLANTPSYVLNAAASTGKAPIHYIMDENVGGNSERLQKVKLLVHCGKDLPSINDISSTTGYTPLAQAYKRDYKGVCEVLMTSKDINIDARSADGFSVIHYAAKKCDNKFIKAALLRRAGDSKMHGQKFPMPEGQGVTPAMYAVREVKDVGKLKKVLDQLMPHEPSPDLVAIEAVRNGQRGIIQHITKEIVNPRDTLVGINGERTGLVAESLKAGRFDIANMLAKAGAPLEGQVREPAVALAIRGGCFEGRDAVKRVRKLIKRGASINVPSGERIASPLIASVNTGRGSPNIGVVRELLRQGAVLNAQDEQGNTSLHHAVLSGNRDVVRTLVNHGASAEHANDNGYNPLHVAAGIGDVKIFKMLANKYPEAVGQVNPHDGSTVFHSALSNNVSQKDIAKMLKSAKRSMSPEAFSDLLSAQHYDTGDTVLHIAARNGYGEVCKILIKAGAEVGVLNAQGRGPLEDAHASLSSIRMSTFSRRTIAGTMLKMLEEVDLNSLKPFIPLKRKSDADYHIRDGGSFLNFAGAGGDRLNTREGRAVFGDLGDQGASVDAEGLDVLDDDGDKYFSDLGDINEPIYENLGLGKSAGLENDGGYYSLEDIEEGLDEVHKATEGVVEPTYANVQDILGEYDTVEPIYAKVDHSKKLRGQERERVFGSSQNVVAEQTPEDDAPELPPRGYMEGGGVEDPIYQDVDDIFREELTDADHNKDLAAKAHGSVLESAKEESGVDIEHGSNDIVSDDRGTSIESSAGGYRSRVSFLSSLKVALLGKKDELKAVDSQVEKKQPCSDPPSSLVHGLAGVIEKASSKMGNSHARHSFLDDDDGLSASDEEWEAEEQEHSEKSAKSYGSGYSSPVRASSESAGKAEGINTQGWTHEDMMSLRILADSVLHSSDDERGVLSSGKGSETQVGAKGGSDISDDPERLSNDEQLPGGHAGAVVNSRRNGHSGGVSR
ncbi:MAG: ankyrin repeat domain-containing protein, partial [Aaplasma endosymbiont of Hyalomma asiaticum]